VVLFIAVAISAVGLGATFEESWNDLLHYAAIGRLDLAKGHAQAVLDSQPDPIELLELSQANPRGYSLLVKARESSADSELAELCGQIVDIVEQGRFDRRTDPRIIIEEIKRLSGTSRGRVAAIKRLENAGEYAIMFMLDAMADPERNEELPNIIWALSRIGRDSIRPLAAALQTSNVAVKAEAIRALGKIGYPQSLPYLKYILEKDDSPELRGLAEQSITDIEPAAVSLSAAELFYRLGEDYYYHAESLAPAEDADFANVWFWDEQESRLMRKEVDRSYFNELMTMRCCEWAVKADAGFGQAIGLWLAGFFKAESAGLDMPEYFGPGHADAMTYATTAGPEYLHQALARAVRDKDAYVALGIIEALGTTAGQSSLFYAVGNTQPLADALSFNNRAVRYSAAIAVAAAGPAQQFPQSKLVVENLAEAIGQSAEQVGESTQMWNGQLADSYAVRAAKVMLKLGQTRNLVLDLSPAEPALAEATKDKRPDVQMLAGQILAYLRTATAQEAVAVMALNDEYAQDVRISAFNSLAVSAKQNGSLLDGATIESLYSLVGSDQVDAELRAAAAAAYGALNLPSQEVKNLILDQARS